MFFTAPLEEEDEGSATPENFWQELGMFTRRAFIGKDLVSHDKPKENYTRHASGIRTHLLSTFRFVLWLCFRKCHSKNCK